MEYAISYSSHVPNVNKKKTYVAQRGYNNILSQIFTANNITNSNANFSITTNNTKTLIDRVILMKASVDFVFDKPGGTSPIFGPGGLDNNIVKRYISVKPIPIHSSISSMSLVINNGNVSIIPNEMIQEAMQYNTDVKDYYARLSMTPIVTEKAYTYAALSNTVLNPLVDQTGAAVYETRRGQFIRCIENSNTRGVVRIEVCEPLFISPLVWSNFKANNAEFLSNVSNLQLTLSFDDFVNKWLAIDDTVFSLAGINISYNLSASTTSVLQLICSFYDAPDDVEIPQVQYLNYSKQDRQSTQLGVFTAGETKSVILNNIQLASIPKRVLIYAKSANYSATRPQTWMVINNISVLFDNQDAQLSQLQPENLYDISCRNGSIQTWKEFSETVGSVLALDFNDNIVLRNDKFVGLSGSFNFSLKVSLTNKAPYQQDNVNIYAIFFSDGLTVISPSVCNFFSSVNGLPRNVKEFNTVIEQLNNLQSDFTGNGSFKDFLNETKNKVKEYAPKVLKGIEEYGPKVLSAAKWALPLLMGLGMTKKQAEMMIENEQYMPILKANGLIGAGDFGDVSTGGKMANSKLKKLNRRLI